jgi:hypothetical protein
MTLSETLRNLIDILKKDVGRLREGTNIQIQVGSFSDNPRHNSFTNSIFKFILISCSWVQNSLTVKI